MKEREEVELLNFDVKHFTKEALISAAIQSAFDLGLPVAVWRLPNQNEINLIVSFTALQQLQRVEFPTLPKGFLIAPFEKDKKGNQFIKADFHLSFDFDEVIEGSDISSDETATGKAFKTQLIERLSNPVEKPEYFSLEKAVDTSVDYKALVQKSIDYIKSGVFEKVVPARAAQFQLPQHFDPVSLFMNICQQYTNAFAYFVSTPEIGTWMGATPELLLSKQQNIFKTVALAGTKRFDADTPIEETAWLQKEIEEQALVSRYIISCFKKIRLREFEERGPRTSKAGNLLHLKTTYEVDVEATNFPELPTVMLELLHPTSAVAGMPKTETLQFLSEYEGLDRAYYSGFLGPVNLDEQTNIFVNLRCMQVDKHTTTLYAGAGVTEDSVPEKEYLETEMKFNTLRNLIYPAS
ncbi:chorismate-binding protein [Roseivirga pacifica]|uniref:chorismate-binding protein n=1 Tax=Roseivirga pacifica TaxID=1267423 RepID=UPI003BAA1511